jgi:hypothetical protein
MVAGICMIAVGSCASLKSIGDSTSSQECKTPCTRIAGTHGNPTCGHCDVVQVTTGTQFVHSYNPQGRIDLKAHCTEQTLSLVNIWI